MTSNLKSDSQVQIYSLKSNSSYQVQQFKHDSSRNLDSESNQQIMIPNSVSNSINNLSPTKLNFTKTFRKSSILHQHKIRENNIIISCQNCENIDDLNLIQPCLCDVNYHPSCFKQKLLNTPGLFNEESFICNQCGTQYKIKKVEIYQSKKIINLCNIILFGTKLIIILGGLGGLSYWFYSYTQQEQEMSSLIAVIVLLILLFLVYFVYLILEIFRGDPKIDWEILDYKSEIALQLNAEELNLLENRSKLQLNERPIIQHQITSVQYPQNNLNEIIN